MREAWRDDIQRSNTQSLMSSIVLPGYYAQRLLSTLAAQTR